MLNIILLKTAYYNTNCIYQTELKNNIACIKFRNNVLVGWLFNGKSTQKRQFVSTVGGGKPAQSAKDGQRDTMHITLRYTITM